MTLKLPRSVNIKQAVEIEVDKAVSSVRLKMTALKGLDITQAWAKWEALHDHQG